MLTIIDVQLQGDKWMISKGCYLGGLPCSKFKRSHTCVFKIIGNVLCNNIITLTSYIS